MPNPAPGFKKNPNRIVRLEPSPRRVRVKFGDEWIADSTNTVLMYETGHLPVYYFPMRDVRLELMQPTSHESYCQYKGHASYWSIKAGDRESVNAVWAYQTPYDEMTAINLQDYCAFYWERVDHWFEEDEEVFAHPRDPYKRVDALPSSRPVRVILGGVAIADTTNALFLFETGLPTRFYIPASDVRMELLVESATTSICPYKGKAKYFSAEIAGVSFPDIAWVYPQPIPECQKVGNLICFYNEKVDAIFIDGAEIDKTTMEFYKGD